MFLQEEYFHRHGITGVPVVIHTGGGALLLQDRRDGEWLQLIIGWYDEGNRPGKYHINVSTPIHDAYRMGTFFMKNFDQDVTLEWDQYQDYLLKWGKVLRTGSRAVVGEVEVILAYWEVFTYCIDGWLAREADATFRTLHFASIDLAQPIGKRYDSYLAALAYLSINHPDMARVFREEFNYLENYCHWLGRLVNGDNRLD